MSEAGSQPGHGCVDNGGSTPHGQSVSSYVDTAEAVWSDNGLSSRTRRRLAHELEEGLIAALAEGADPEEILAVDARTLAAEIAAAEGLYLTGMASSDASLRGLVTWALGSATAMAAFVWFFALMPVARLFYNDSSTTASVVSLSLIYGSCGAVTLGAAAVGMGHYLRALESTRRTVALATAAMALTGSIGVGICVVVGWLTNYSSAPAVILLYVLIVGALMATGIAAVWVAELRTSA